MTTQIPVQTRVRDSSGRTGTVCPDLIACCSPGEIPVVYDSTDILEGTLRQNLEIIGPENATPSPKGCGIGKGDECCIFLTVSANGFECQRFSTMRWTLVLRTMVAKRHPKEPYPSCMDQAGGKA